HPSTLVRLPLSLHDALPISALIDGPGRVCRYLEIDRSLNELDLTAGRSLWIEDRGEQVAESRIAAFPRIGVDYAGAWAAKPWRLDRKSTRLNSSQEWMSYAV